MFDRVVWELTVMIRRADFAYFSGDKLVAGLSVCPDVLPGDQEPRDWQRRFGPIETGDQHHHETTPDEVREVLPSASQISWGQLATVDAFQSRVWLYGRGEGLVLGVSKANPGAPCLPDHDTLIQIGQELFELRDAMLAP